MQETFHDLNADINLWDEEGKLQLHKDREAATAYFREYVNPNTVFFHDLEEKAKYLIENGFWDGNTVRKYSFDQFKELFKHAYSFKFRFPTFMGAFKFYTSYALKTHDGTRFLERYEDRVTMTAIAFSEDFRHAKDVITEIMEGRFQPATPTFLNGGRANAGAPVSCFLMRVEDNLESINRSITDSMQLSKRGGGVGLLMTNIRESGAPIKKNEGLASGLVPLMKMYEGAFSYIDQLGQRSGAGAVYLSAHHPDIMTFLDTKRENADEKIRIKTLSLGVVIPDITFELARNNEDMYLFSPYDVEKETGIPLADHSITERYREWVDNPRITKKKINARKFFTTLAKIQFESGYPYIMFDDAANKGNVAPNLGRITHSNLCSEIFQPFVPSTFYDNGSFENVGMDVSCNLGSLNVAKMLKQNGVKFRSSVTVAYKFLNRVAELSEVTSSPSIMRGNASSKAIGLGQMNLHGALIELGIPYESEKARVLFDTYMAEVTSAIIYASVEMAKKRGQRFLGFEGSRWQSGEVIDEIQKHYERIHIADRPEIVADEPIYWEGLKDLVKKHGLYNRNLQAIPPTGSISYINNSTASIHPITAPIEIRKEGKLGRVYYPAYGLTSDNINDIKDAYEIGPEPLIDMYATAAPYIDQGMSMTLFFPDTATTRDVNKAQIYAHKAGVKSIYYIRLRQQAMEGMAVEECVSCTL